MKLPKNAKRVFKGQIFQIYQWRQKMFDNFYSSYRINTASGKSNGQYEILAYEALSPLKAISQDPTLASSLAF